MSVEYTGIAVAFGTAAAVVVEATVDVGSVVGMTVGMAVVDTGIAVAASTAVEGTERRHVDAVVLQHKEPRGSKGTVDDGVSLIEAAGAADRDGDVWTTGCGESEALQSRTSDRSGVEGDSDGTSKSKRKQSKITKWKKWKKRKK